MDAYFKSMIEMDRAPVVICNLDHIIIYMNPSAKKNYHKYNNGELVGTNLLDCHNARSCEIIKNVVAWFGESVENNMIYTYYNEKKNVDEYMVALRDETGKLIGYYEKHEARNHEGATRYDFTKSLV